MEYALIPVVLFIVLCVGVMVKDMVAQRREEARRYGPEEQE